MRSYYESCWILIFIMLRLYGIRIDDAISTCSKMQVVLWNRGWIFILRFYNEITIMSELWATSMSLFWTLLFCPCFDTRFFINWHNDQTCPRLWQFGQKGDFHSYSTSYIISWPCSAWPGICFWYEKVLVTSTDALAYEIFIIPVNLSILIGMSITEAIQLIPLSSNRVVI